MKERKEVATDGEPLFTYERSVQSYGSGDDLQHNIPQKMVEMLDLDDDDYVEIDCYQNGYVVRRKPKRDDPEL